MRKAIRCLRKRAEGAWPRREPWHRGESVCINIVEKRTGETMDYKRKIRKAITMEAIFFAVLGLLVFYEVRQRSESVGTDGSVEYGIENNIWANIEETESEAVETEAQTKTATDGAVEKDFIKWVDFSVAAEALKTAMEIDIETYHSEVHIPWTSLLAYEATKTGGKITAKHVSDLKAAAEKLKCGELSFAAMEADNQYYSYYKEAYEAVLGGMLGEYEKEIVTEENSQTTGDSVEKKSTWETVYGLKAYHPIAGGFSFSDYDDFGVSRTYGYKRRHLGHDMMGLVGTPIIAVESGYVEALGWNQYGGWRIGIRSFDKKRYYYYAHLRQNYPFAEGLSEGDIVTAGDVIGYMGHTGYSSEENVNNINETHLHFGLQLIFDESQKDGNTEIWIDCYQLVRFLYQNKQEAAKVGDTREWKRVTLIKDPAVEEYKKENEKDGTKQ